jgi:hypothetical protein
MKSMPRPYIINAKTKKGGYAAMACIPLECTYGIPVLPYNIWCTLASCKDQVRGIGETLMESS